MIKWILGGCMINKKLLTGAPENNIITIERNLGGVKYITEIFSMERVERTIATPLLESKTTIAIDTDVIAIVAEQQEIARAILELLKEIPNK